LYLAAICALQTGQRTDSIRYGIRLAGLVETAKDPLEAECLLYPYLLRCTIADATGGYTTELYTSLTEEESSLLMENTFLYDYMTAAHLWSRNSEEARTQALELLDGILDNHPDLSRAWYMKGAMLHERQEDDEAEAALLTSLATDDEQPTAWYALATLYARTKEYEASYAACRKVIQYLPASDHDFDVFGVSIHTQQLMSRLEPLIKGGD
jgi:predicted Zn-dependent protease